MSEGGKYKILENANRSIGTKGWEIIGCLEREVLGEDYKMAGEILRVDRYIHFLFWWWFDRDIHVNIYQLYSQSILYMFKVINYTPYIYAVYWISVIP